MLDDQEFRHKFGWTSTTWVDKLASSFVDNNEETLTIETKFAHIPHLSM